MAIVYDNVYKITRILIKVRLTFNNEIMFYVVTLCHLALKLGATVKVEV